MNEVYIGSDHVLTYGDYSDFLVHKHMAQHILIGINGKIQCLVEDETIFCDGIFIDGMKTHTIVNNGTKMLIFMIDDITSISNQMKKKYLDGQGYYLLSNSVVTNINNIWHESKSVQSDFDFFSKSYSNTFNLMMQACGIERDLVQKRDSRVEKVIQSLKKKDSIEKDVINDLAKEVFLSSSRLSHLFKKETGVTLKNYLLLMKIRKTYIYLIKGYSLSDASIQAGFSSLSHFVTTNRKWFGMSIKQQQKQISKLIETEIFADDAIKIINMTLK